MTLTNFFKDNFNDLIYQLNTCSILEKSYSITFEELQQYTIILVIPLRNRHAQLKRLVWQITFNLKTILNFFNLKYQITRDCNIRV